MRPGRQANGFLADGREKYAIPIQVDMAAFKLSQ
jgi:hypothetical protein